MPDDAEDARGAAELRLAAQVHRLSQLLSRPFVQEHAAKVGLSHAEWRVLAQIVQEPGTTAAEISVATAFTPMHVSRAVQVLRSKGFIASSADPADSRRQLLEATETGAQTFASLVPFALHDVRSVMSTLTASEFDAFVGYLDRVVESARQRL